MHIHRLHQWTSMHHTYWIAYVIYMRFHYYIFCVLYRKKMSVLFSSVFLSQSFLISSLFISYSFSTSLTSVFRVFWSQFYYYDFVWFCPSPFLCQSLVSLFRAISFFSPFFLSHIYCSDIVRFCYSLIFFAPFYYFDIDLF